MILPARAKSNPIGSDGAQLLAEVGEFPGDASQPLVGGKKQRHWQMGLALHVDRLVDDLQCALQVPIDSLRVCPVGQIESLGQSAPIESVSADVADRSVCLEFKWDRQL
jgi:hypothetical protein